MASNFKLCGFSSLLKVPQFVMESRVVFVFGELSTAFSVIECGIWEYNIFSYRMLNMGI
jgi:hypothetical protein